MKKLIIMIVLLSMVIPTMAAQELFAGTAVATPQDINAAAKALRIDGTDLDTGAFLFPTQMARAHFNIGGAPEDSRLTLGASVTIQCIESTSHIVFTDTFTVVQDILATGKTRLRYTSPAFLAVIGKTYAFWIISDAAADDDVQIDSGGSLLISDDPVNADGEVTPAGSVLIQTTIAAYTSNTNFTLTNGSGDDDAYNDSIIVIEDQTTAVQKAVGFISDYAQSAKTITLVADPLAVFTFANGDKVTILAKIGDRTNGDLDVNSAQIGGNTPESFDDTASGGPAGSIRQKIKSGASKRYGS